MKKYCGEHKSWHLWRVRVPCALFWDWLQSFNRDIEFQSDLVQFLIQLSINQIGRVSLPSLANNHLLINETILSYLRKIHWIYHNSICNHNQLIKLFSPPKSFQNRWHESIFPYSFNENLMADNWFGHAKWVVVWKQNTTSVHSNGQSMKFTSTWYTYLCLLLINFIQFCS